MRRLTRPALLVLFLLCLRLPILARHVDSVKALYEKGADAEARQNYEQAFDYFKQAYNLKPKDLRYRAAFERSRFLAGSSEVHRAQILRDDGKLEEAAALFQKALETDPSSFIAQQELKRTLQMIKEAQHPEPEAVPPGTTTLRKRLASAEGPVELAPISNLPLTLKVTDKSDVIYQTVGKLAGINVLFDPDYKPAQVRVELNNVTLEDALRIVSLETKTFWRPVTPNTIFVATDNAQKRKELEQNVIKTFYFSNLSQQTELQDVVNAIRTVLEVSKIQSLASQGAIVVRGTPDQVALAQSLVDDLDKAKPEVLIEIAVMQVSRDKSRTLGISPPTSVSVALQPNVTTSSSSSSSTTTSSSSSNSLSLNTLNNLNATDFQVTIPAASAQALMGASDTKLIQNPQIRALDGQKATMKIGERVPIATGSYSSGIGSTGTSISPLTNTQFQYLDVGVNIEITPRVHAGREISLKLTMDVLGRGFVFEHWRHQPTGDRPAQDRARYPPEGWRSEPAGRHDGGLADAVPERDSRPGLDADSEVFFWAGYPRPYGERDRIRDHPAHCSRARHLESRWRCARRGHGHHHSVAPIQRQAASSVEYEYNFTGPGRVRRSPAPAADGSAAGPVEYNFTGPGHARRRSPTADGSAVAGPAKLGSER